MHSLKFHFGNARTPVKESWPCNVFLARFESVPRLNFFHAENEEKMGSWGGWRTEMDIEPAEDRKENDTLGIGIDLDTSL